MATVRWGSMPKAFGYKAVPEQTDSGRNRSSLSADNMQWDLSEGWHYKRQRGWKGQGVKSGTVEKVQRTTPDGRKVTMYKSKGYDDYIGFHSHENGMDDNPDMFAYAMHAFNKEAASHGKVYESEGCGHIKKLKYNSEMQVLWVEFENRGDICVFFRVPSAVGGTLLHHAQSKSMGVSAKSGQQRHLLGMEFWDLVRIRGQLHGAKYPFEYMKHGNYKLTSSNKRYKVTLSDENIKTVLGPRYHTANLKPGETVSAIVDEQEFARYLDTINSEKDAKSAKLGVRQLALTNKDGVEKEQEFDSVESDLYASANDFDPKFIQTTLGSDAARYLDLQSKLGIARNTYRENLKEAVKESAAAQLRALVPNVEDYMKDPKYQDKEGNFQINWVYNEKLKDVPEIDHRTRFTNEYNFSLGGQNKIHQNAGAYSEKASLYDKVLPLREAFSREEYNDYVRMTRLLNRKHKTAKYAVNSVGVPWTVQKLKDFANPTVLGNITLAHADEYKRLIKGRNYEAALNFLKNHKRSLSYKNEDTGKVGTTKLLPYAGPYDFLSLEEQ